MVCPQNGTAVLKGLKVDLPGLISTTAVASNRAVLKWVHHYCCCSPFATDAPFLGAEHLEFEWFVSTTGLKFEIQIVSIPRNYGRSSYSTWYVVTGNGCICAHIISAVSGVDIYHVRTYWAAY